jgi:putative membrane protein
MRSIDQTVEQERFTISVVFPILGSVLLIASSFSILETTLWGYTISLNFNPYLILFGTLVMRLPLISGVKPLVNGKVGTGIVLLILYSYLIEFVGVITNWPYGSFEYGISLGPMIYNLVPLALPIFFLPLVVNSYLLVLQLSEKKLEKIYWRIPMVITLVLLLDVILDPAAVSLGFWSYSEGGAFYGVPISNFLGWILSASVTVCVLDYVFESNLLKERLDSCEYILDDLVSFTLMWTSVNVIYQNWVSVLCSVILLIILVNSDFEFPSKR